MLRKGKKTIKYLISAGVLSVLILVLTALKSSAYVSEYIFTRGISRWYIFGMGHFSDLLPFSFFEILCGVGIVWLIVDIVLSVIDLVKHRFVKLSVRWSRILVVVLSVLLIYTSTASFSYSRLPIDEHIPMASELPENYDAEELYNWYVTELNTLADKMQRDENGITISPYTIDELGNIMVNDEMSRLESGYFSEYTPKPKSIISSNIMSAFGILGISFQPTAEANINSNTVDMDLPYIMAHELSHSKGIMREGDAESVAEYITLTSKDDYIRYSGMCNYYSDMLKIVGLNGKDYRDYRLKINDNVRRDFLDRKNSYSADTNIEIFVEEVGNFFNDIYLKMSGVKQGVDSYTQNGNIVFNNGNKAINYSNNQKIIIQLFTEGLANK